MKSNRKSFEHFYLTKVALGDCCGCAERVIDWRDIELAAANRQPASEAQRAPRPVTLATWFQTRAMKVFSRAGNRQTDS